MICANFVLKSCAPWRRQANMVQKEVFVGRKAKNYKIKLAMKPYQDT
jgi:hypothetical protein